MKGQQASIFDGNNSFKITKPIRLITLFSGYDSQALALKYLGVPFEHYHTCEWAIPSIQALKDLHFDYDKGDYSKGLSKNDLVDILCKKGMSADYNTPLTKEQLGKYSEEKLRTIFNNIIAARNLVSICNINGDDLEIVDTDKYEYIMTYSFPCQDLSAAGLRAGMSKGSGTRSGLLWEVERLLRETKELPQIILMENVKQVIGKANINAFAEWIATLDELGYHSKWQILNATEFGVPQNRERCFMVSVLGDNFYTMPHPIKRDKKLSDLLEKEVDSSYDIPEKKVEYYIQHTKDCEDKGLGFRFAPTDGDGIAKAITTRAGGANGRQFHKPQEGKIFSFNYGCSEAFLRPPRLELARCLKTDGKGGIIMKECNCVGRLGGKYENCNDSARRVYDVNGCSPCLTTCGGGNLDPKVQEQNLRVRKLTEKECFRLMGVKDEDYEKIARNQSKSKLYHLAGDSIVTTCLMALFGQLLDVDWETKIREVLG